MPWLVALVHMQCENNTPLIHRRVTNLLSLLLMEEGLSLIHSLLVTKSIEPATNGGGPLSSRFDYIQNTHLRGSTYVQC